ncbi:MAG: serine hydrolase, partial [Candidatus Promineifilaceae bacterium]
MIPLSAKGKIERRRWIACLIILSLISLALASCDGENTPETPTTAPTLTAAAPSATATSTAATAPQSQPTPTDEVESGETPLAATESVPAETSCGVILPLVASDIVEPTSRIDRGLVDSSKVPAAAQPALERILADPSSVGLVAFEVGSEESGIYFNADTAMPLASVAKIINLVAYANAVEVGLIDPAERIPFSDIEATYLPGSDLGAHRAARAELEQQGFLIGEDPTVPIEEIPWMM